MKQKIFIFDPTLSDKKSKVRGVGRYLQILKENFPDWIYTDSLKQIPSDSVFINPFFNFLQKPLTIKRLAKKQIAVIHDLIPLKYPAHFPAGIRGNINIILNKLALKNYDLIITDSQASKKDIIDILKISEKKIKVIYPCLLKLFESYQVKKLEKSDEITFSLPANFCLYVGDGTWNKNLVNLAKAIKIINVPCVFVGKVFELKQKSTQKIAKNADLRKRHAWLPTINIPFTATSLMHFRKDAFETKNHPWQQEFNQFLNEVKDDKRFIFAGFVDNYRLVKLYQQAKVNILVSRAEGFGFSYLEAANFGCPSVLSDIPVFHEISDNQGAVFTNPNDPNDIADKISEVYFHNNLRTKLSLEAQKQAKHFSQKKFKEEFLNLIENLIKYPNND